MAFRIALPSIALLLILSPLASAYSLVTTEKLRGEIQNVDTHNNSIEIVSHTGRSKILEFSEDTRFVFEGDASDLTNFKPGSRVSLTHRAETPIKETLEGEIIALDKDQRTVYLRQANREVKKIKLGTNLSVSGLDAVSSLNDLKKGHIVTIRYAQ